MSYTPYTTAAAPRMQTNAAWDSPSISFQSGVPPTLVDISGWTLTGVAVGEKGKRVALDVGGGKIVFDGTTAFHVALTKTDMGLLGHGCVEIEIMRAAPDPIRPLVKLKGVNHQGLS